MPEESTDVIPSETGSEVETPKTPVTEAVEGSETTDDVKQEQSPYLEELEAIKKREADLVKEVEERKRQLELKDRALQAEKKKAKEATPDDLEERIKRSVNEALQAGDVSRHVNGLTSDTHERELILHHYENSIIKTGNLAEDVMTALAVANRKVVAEQRANAAREEGRENFLTSLPQSDIRGQQKATITDPVLREAAKLVQNVNPKAVQYLKR